VRFWSSTTARLPMCGASCRCTQTSSGTVPNGFGELRLARTISRIRSARVVLLGVRPGFRGRGIAILLAEELAAAGRECNIQDGELSLVQASNDPIRHSIEALGGKPVKTYRLFVRSLSND